MMKLQIFKKSSRYVKPVFRKPTNIKNNLWKLAEESDDVSRIVCNFVYGLVHGFVHGLVKGLKR